MQERGAHRDANLFSYASAFKGMLGVCRWRGPGHSTASYTTDFWVYKLYLCLALSVVFYFCKSSLPLLSLSTIPDYLVFSFLRNQVPGGDKPCVLDAVL